MNAIKYMAIIAVLTGCGGQYYAKIGLGKNGNVTGCDCWDDGGSVGTRLAGGWRHQIKGNLYGDVNYYHHSQAFVGPPFNDDPETSADHFYYDLEYRF